MEKIIVKKKFTDETIEATVVTRESEHIVIRIGDEGHLLTRGPAGWYVSGRRYQAGYEYRP